MCFEVVHEMKRRGHRVLLIYGSEGTGFELYEKAASAAYKIRLAPLGLRNPVSSATLISRLLRLIRREHIDLLFSTNIGNLRTTGVLRLLTGVPAVYHFGLVCGPDPRIDSFTRWAIRRTSLAIAPTIRVAESWQAARAAAEWMEVCPNWTDTDRFRRLGRQERQERRQSLGISPDDPVVIYVGRLSAQKGIPILLEAAKRLAARGIKFSLVLIGDLESSYKEDFDLSIGALKLGKCRFHIIPQINNPQDYLSVADVAVVPGSAPEAFGLTLIEAMSSELPTIAPNANSFAEILGPENADLLFAPRSIEECAELLKKWICADDASRLARGRQLRARVLRDYSAKNAVRYEHLFFSVAKRSSGLAN